jgi:hypothetical protein
LERFNIRGWIDEDFPLHSLLGELFVARSAAKMAVEGNYPSVMAQLLNLDSSQARKAALKALSTLSSHGDLQEEILAKVRLESIAGELWPELRKDTKPKPPLNEESILNAKETLHNIYCGPCFKKFDSLHQKLSPLQNHSRTSDERASALMDFGYYGVYGGFLGTVWGMARGLFARQSAALNPSKAHPRNLFLQHGVKNAFGAAYFILLYNSNEYFDKKFMQDVSFPTYFSYSVMSTVALIGAMYSITRWAPFVLLPSSLTAVAIQLKKFRDFDENELPSTFAAAVKSQQKIDH